MITHVISMTYYKTILAYAITIETSKETSSNEFAVHCTENEVFH